MLRKSIVILAAVILIFSACKSRLSLPIYQVAEDGEILLIDNETYYLKGMILADKPEVDPIGPGSGQVLVIKRNIADSLSEEIKTGLITSARELEYRIFIDLPEQLKLDSFSIEDKSICRFLGDYNLPDQETRYYCRDGILKIDSLKSNRFTGYFSGKYFNIDNDSLIFKGRINARRKQISP